MLRRALGLAVLLALGVGCRDGPTALVAPPEDGPVEPSVPPPIVYKLSYPVLLVSQFPNDPFVQPMLFRVVGPVVAHQLTTSLGSIAVTPTQQTFLDAIQALTGVQRQIQVERSQPETPAMQTDVADDPEALIIQDALGLIVDDALQVLLTASDSVGA
jgi:hypothetical protein